MRVFLSWSGDRSKGVVNILYTWIAKVIQAVDPWMSSEIQKGGRWGTEVAKELEQSRVGIVCLTKDNLNENWILFEAGALSKATDGNVWTLLVDVKPTDVQQPLAQFQHTICEKEDIRRLLHTINAVVRLNKERTISDSLLDGVFETNWPELSGALKEIASKQPLSAQVERTEKEMLQEVLEIVRGQERGKASRSQLRESIVRQLAQEKLLLLSKYGAMSDPEVKEIHDELQQMAHDSGYSGAKIRAEDERKIVE